jgi:anti-sigma factor RsiW
MSCGKYSGWMTDAALGELPAKCVPKLLAHAMECDACREALAHATKVREFVERRIESVVAASLHQGSRRGCGGASRGKRAACLLTTRGCRRSALWIRKNRFERRLQRFVAEFVAARE